MVGVTITTFNRKRFTEQCFKSIIWSKPKNVKMVVVDNASRKETKKLIRKFSEENSDLIEKVIFNKENYYVGKAIVQGWEYLSKTCDILGCINNDFFVEPGWEDNIIRCFSELNIDFVIGSVDPKKEKIRKKTPSGKGFYNTPVGGVGSAYFILTKHFLRGFYPSSIPFKSGYVGPAPSYHKKLLRGGLKGVRVCHPGAIVRNPEYTNPELVEYYNKTFKIRGLMRVLRIRRSKEKSGSSHGIWNWNEFLLNCHPDKFEKEKE